MKIKGLKIDKVKLNKYLNKYYAVIAISLVLFILVIGAVIIYPQYKQLVSVREQQLQTSESDLLQKTRYLEDLRIMEVNFEETNIENFRNLDKVLISEDEFPQMFARIESLVDSAGLLLMNMSYSVTRAEDEENASDQASRPEEETSPSLIQEDLPNGIGLMTVNITAQTSQNNWDGFKKFLTHLEQNIELLNIYNITYTPGQETYSLSFEMYYKEEKNASSKDK